MFNMPTALDIAEALGAIGHNALYLPDLVKRCQTGGIVPFVGAGMSRPLFPLWGDFLLGTATNPKLQAEIKTKLDAVEYEEAASLLHERLGWRLFEDLLRDAFADKHLPAAGVTGAVTRLAEFCPGPLVTTNFDRVIETAFAQAGKPLLPVWHSQAIKGAEALQRNEPFLLKLHGDWQDMQNRVLTREEYEAAYGDADVARIDYTRAIPQLLSILLPGRSCLFLGCSLQQDRTMSILKIVARTYRTTHFAAVKRPSDEDEFQTRIQQLSNLGICPIWYPEHDWLDPLLEYLARKSLASPRRGLPSPTTRPEPPNNIPRPPNLTVGRVEEIRQIGAMVGGARLVTIVGTGGCGKTRVAMEVAQQIRHDFPDGVWYVDLANLSEKADKEQLLPARLGSIAGVPQQPGRPPLIALVERFATGKYLCILDNCEHLVDSCNKLISDLLQGCPGFRFLATSRRPLESAEQRLYPLTTLRVPDPEASWQTLSENESVQLFKARAGKAFVVTSDNAVSVAQLCRALDGLPLAIELAAARLGVRSVQQMNKESRTLLDSLKGVRIDDLRHWRTLNAALEWSYRLLSEPLRKFLQPLAIFDGGWTEEGAAAIYASGTVDMLQELLDNSMIVSQESKEVARFRLLEPVRQFVRAKLTPAEATEYQRRHASIFAALAEKAGPQLSKGDQANWLSIMQQEIDNFRAAFRWALEDGDTETALRLTGSLWRFLEIRGYFTEGRGRAAEAIAMAEAENHPALLERALSGAGWLAYRQADFAQSEGLLTRALAIAESLADGPEIANALNDLGNIARIHGNYELARERIGRCLEWERQVGNRRMIGVALYNLGAIALDEGNLDEASRKLAESLEEFREQSNSREIAFPLRGLAEVALFRGELDLARDYAGESLEIRIALKDSKGRADTLCTLAWIEIEDDNLPAAWTMLQESLSWAKAISDRRTISEALEVAALAHSHQGNAATATQLLAGAARIRKRIGFGTPPVRKTFLDAIVMAARQQLGDLEYKGQHARGTSRETDTLIEMAANNDVHYTS